MNNSNILTDQDISKTNIGGSIYVAIDGIVKQCITAPLLELPIDFKEWYKPSRSYAAQLHQI